MALTLGVSGDGVVAVSSETNTSAEGAAASAVSWAAIIAGAVAATAATVILLVLGAGVGLAMVSPWYGAGASAASVGVSAVIWLVIVQWFSSGLGGFLAGRLQTKWLSLHTHEVFFRDTAHGFLTWSVASVAGAVLFASVTASGLGGVARGSAGAAAMMAPGATRPEVRNGYAGAASDASAYFVDTLFRSAKPGDGDNADSRAETARILVASMRDGQLVPSSADSTYIAQLVAVRTGLSQPEAEQRVGVVVKQINDAEQKTREAADVARKRGAQLSIVTALSMMIGAFIASVAAALGGSIRDEY